ncbi:hypothetical protein NL676_000258 [Syzygium grande]|nr:hypothetical protein NL676_000258 [Syzygium grande]
MANKTVAMLVLISCVLSSIASTALGCSGRENCLRGPTPTPAPELSRRLCMTGCYNRNCRHAFPKDLCLSDCALECLHHE